MADRKRWARVVTLGGGIAVLVGAIDPMEGSLLILPGSALVALGAWLDGSERRLLAYRAWTFILIAFGVGALWGASAAGGIGGPKGHSMWWGVLILPYLAGWLLTIWGPAPMRGFHAFALAIGLWYLAIPIMLLLRGRPAPEGASDMGHAPILVVGILGALTIAGCVRRLRRRA